MLLELLVMAAHVVFHCLIVILQANERVHCEEHCQFACSRAATAQVRGGGGAQVRGGSGEGGLRQGGAHVRGGSGEGGSGEGGSGEGGLM